MTDFNPGQERLRQAVLNELEECGGDALTSQLRDALYPEYEGEYDKKPSFKRYLLRVGDKMEENEDIRTTEEHTTSSRGELRWHKL